MSAAGSAPPADDRARRYSDRLLPPGETWARIEPHLFSHGITRMARLTGLDRIGLPVWSAAIPNARSLSVAQGKGLTDEEAKVSAAMEALERVVAGSPFPGPLLASARELRAAGLRAETLPSLTAAGIEDLDAADPAEWVAGTDIRTGEPVHLPLQAVALDRTARGLRFWQSSDGLASGNGPDEAVFHALLERIERDAEALWLIGTQRARAASRFDPADLGDPLLDSLVDRIRSVGLAPVFMDMTSDTAIPAILCHIGPGDIGARSRIARREVTAGGGAHPDPVRAAIRAVTEAAQSRLTFISGARDDIEDAHYRDALPEGARDLFLAPCSRPRRWNCTVGRIDAMTRDILSRLDRKGCGPAYRVALADPALPFAVEKVIAPGLENPPGARLRRFGSRALLKAVRG